MNIEKILSGLENGSYDEKLLALYGKERLCEQRKRWADAARQFLALYGNAEGAGIFSVPGRTEVSGNHTDHNRGRVLAASIDLDIIAVAAPAEGTTIRVKSEGFDEDIVDISVIDPEKAEKYHSSALIAGVCAGLKNRGYDCGGFVAYTTNDVLKGSGMSSSAAFECMIGTIENHFYNDGKVSAPEIAQIGQYAENVFFGKPCGLMDQTACAVGDFVYIDFADPKAAVIEPLHFDLSGHGYTLCITATGGNHADLNEDYASVPAEMKAVAAAFGQEALRGITFDRLIAAIPELREKTGDRAILRAIHFIGENERVLAQAEALKKGDLDFFLDGVLASGRSSWMKLQNIYTTKNTAEQGLSIALAISEQVLSGSGRKAAWRVHGGGFAGTIQAFVPDEEVAGYKKALDAVFGEDACRPLKIRPHGAVRVI